MCLVEKAVRGLIYSALMASLGCCYHAQHFGRKRDIGIFETGCATCVDCPSHGDQTGCCEGGCTPATLPLRTSEIVQSPKAVAITFKDRSRTMVGRLREKIDGPTTERVELVVPPESFGSNRPLPLPTGPPRMVNRDAINSPTALPMVTNAGEQTSPRVPATIVAPLPEVPLPSVPLENHGQD